MAKVKIKINDTEIEVEEGLNLIEAARLAGVEIPHFCYHPGLGVDGNCRMCLVDMEGVPKPQIACNSFAREGLAIRTDSEHVKEMQAAVLEFLFLNHPLDCPICDQSGECYLQDYYMSNGQYDSRLDTDKVHKRKVHPVGERVTLDAERCVLCTRCVRFCQQVTETDELYIVNRGSRAEITTFPDRPLDNDYSLNTVDICPVGALTSNEFRFQKRVWKLSSANSICTGCARGCNTFLDSDDGRAYRYRPRENMDVNRYWMCDPGRMTYRSLNEERLEVAMQGTEDLPYSKAIERVTSMLQNAQGAGSEVQILLSPQSSCETLYAMKMLAAGILDGARIGSLSSRSAGVEDEILRRADANPNAAGLRLLGLDGAPDLDKGGRLLIIVEDDPIGNAPELQGKLAGFDSVLYLGCNENATSRAAGLAMPITPHSECEGSFVNFLGRLQRFEKGITPDGDALWAPKLLGRIAGRMNKEFGWKNARSLWEEMSASEAEFKGIDWDQIGELGVFVASMAPEPASSGTAS